MRGLKVGEYYYVRVLLMGIYPARFIGYMSQECYIGEANCVFELAKPLYDVWGCEIKKLQLGRKDVINILTHKEKLELFAEKI